MYRLHQIKDTYILLKGEPGVEFTTDNITKMKIGDGVTNINNLPFYKETSNIIETKNTDISGNIELKNISAN